MADPVSTILQVQPFPILNLTNELLVEVLIHLPVFELPRVSQVCYLFNAVVRIAMRSSKGDTSARRYILAQRLAKCSGGPISMENAFSIFDQPSFSMIPNSLKQGFVDKIDQFLNNARTDEKTIFDLAQNLSVYQLYRYLESTQNAEMKRIQNVVSGIQNATNTSRMPEMQKLLSDVQRTFSDYINGPDYTGNTDVTHASDHTGFVNVDEDEYLYPTNFLPEQPPIASMSYLNDVIPITGFQNVYLRNSDSDVDLVSDDDSDLSNDDFNDYFIHSIMNSNRSNRYGPYIQTTTDTSSDPVTLVGPSEPSYDIARRATDVRATDVRATDVRATDVRATETKMMEETSHEIFKTEESNVGETEESNVRESNIRESNVKETEETDVRETDVRETEVDYQTPCITQ